MTELKTFNFQLDKTPIVCVFNEPPVSAMIQYFVSETSIS